MARTRLQIAKADSVRLLRSVKAADKPSRMRKRVLDAAYIETGPLTVSFNPPKSGLLLRTGWANLYVSSGATVVVFDSKEQAADAGGGDSINAAPIRVSVSVY